MLEVFAFLCFVGCVFFLLFIFLKVLRRDLSTPNLILEYIVVAVYLLLNSCYTVSLYSSAPYYKAIVLPSNGESSSYEWLASDYILPAVLFYILFLASLFLIWIKGWKLPPIVILLCNCFLLIGIFISIRIIMQSSENKDGSGSISLLVLLPIMNIILALFFILKMMISEYKMSQNRVYQNEILNKINVFFSASFRLYLGIAILVLPVYYVITLVLVLFGQDSDAMTKVFTETTTWAFSQKEHPPYLDDTGHYLCTVAACGNPKNVKPLFVGKRHHHPIIVNRQLQIANAFEELIEVYFPKIHRIIRLNYDQYGYNLSKKINTQFYSDLTYYVMKPLEYFFLIFIYTFSTKPEKLIKKQYQND